METATTSQKKVSNSGTSKLKTNVSALERFLMVTSGGYLLYKGLSKEEQASIKPVRINYWTTFNDTQALEAKDIDPYSPVTGLMRPPSQGR